MTDRLLPRLGDHGPAAARAVEALTALPDVEPSIFVHGDFGPHNLLWETGGDSAGHDPDGITARSVIDLDHAAVGDPAVDVAPLIGIYGSRRVGGIVPAEVLERALVHRATLSLQVAVAAELAGRAALRDHALGSFVRRHQHGVLHDPDGRRPG